jgi:hypothetical protein
VSVARGREAVVTIPTPANLIEWFASLTGKVPDSEKLADAQAAQARERREAERAPQRWVA